MRAFERTTADDCVAAGVRLSIELQTWPRCLPAQPVEENALRWLWPAAVPTVCSRHFLRAPLLPGSYDRLFDVVGVRSARRCTSTCGAGRTCSQPDSRQATQLDRPQMPKSGRVAVEVDTALRLSDQFSPSPNSYP